MRMRHRKHEGAVVLDNLPSGVGRADMKSWGAEGIVDIWRKPPKTTYRLGEAIVTAETGFWAAAGEAAVVVIARDAVGSRVDGMSGRDRARVRRSNASG